MKHLQRKIRVGHKYAKYTPHDRISLIQLVYKNKWKIRKAAAFLKMNISSAKLILKTYSNEKRIVIKPGQNQYLSEQIFPKQPILQTQITSSAPNQTISMFNYPVYPVYWFMWIDINSYYHCIDNCCSNFNFLNQNWLKLE